MDNLLKNSDPLIANRAVLAPVMLAALIQQPWPGNADAMVAQAVSLADKLARAIVAQPVK